MKKIHKQIVFVLFLTSLCQLNSSAQIVSIPGGIIIPGSQNCFPFTVSNSGYLVNPYLYSGYYITSMCINIMTSHPWTLDITLTSPGGTSIHLSSFNGFGGANYTGTCFGDFTSQSITTGMAPFTGTYKTQDYPLTGLFSYYGSQANGTWNFCITDTLTDTTTVASGPPGIGATSTASGTMGFGFSCGPSVRG